MAAPSPSLQHQLLQGRETLLLQQLQLEQQQCERLKQDFTYNLTLLRERDVELEHYDQESVRLRTALENTEAQLQETRQSNADYEREASEQIMKATAATAALSDTEARLQDMKALIAKKAADLSECNEELAALRKEKSELQQQVSSAQQKFTERHQELAAVRNELGMRLYRVQQEHGEAEEAWKRAMAEERATVEARAKTSKAELQREVSSLQTQVERMHAELAQEAGARNALQDELSALREAQTNETMRAQRQRTDMQRAAAALEERDQEVAKLAKRCEAAELQAKQLQTDLALARQQLQESASAAKGDLARAQEEMANELKVQHEDNLRSMRTQMETRLAQLRTELERTQSRLKQHKARVDEAEERARGQNKRAEQLQAEKNALVRESTSLRSEASSSHERAELLQQMLSQRTQYISELQLTAAEREEQLKVYYAEQRQLALQDAQHQYEQERERVACLQRELESARWTHEKESSNGFGLQHQLGASSNGAHDSLGSVSASIAALSCGADKSCGRGADRCSSAAGAYSAGRDDLYSRSARSPQQLSMDELPPLTAFARGASAETTPLAAVLHAAAPCDASASPFARPPQPSGRPTPRRGDWCTPPRDAAASVRSAQLMRYPTPRTSF